MATGSYLPVLLACAGASILGLLLVVATHLSSRKSSPICVQQAARVD